MYADKKKPRQRNRPRNKANRMKCENEFESDKLTEILDVIVTDTENLNMKSSSPVELLENQSVAAAVPPATNEAQQFIPATQEHSDSNDIIRIIQKALRAKLLKQDKHNTTATTIQETDSNKQIAAAKTKSASENAIQSVKKSKDKFVEHSNEKNIFIANLQKKMENVMTSGKPNLSNTLLDNLQKLISQELVSDVETSDDDEEYIEYIYKPRQYFSSSLCHHCKVDLCSKECIPCKRCRMTYYCSQEHMKLDETQHKQLCYALKQVADSCGGHIFSKCDVFTTEQFRSYRIVTIHKVESIMNRNLTATEQEILLFPRICMDIKCREYRLNKLRNCDKCGQVFYCRDKPEHSSKAHSNWCKPYKLFKELIIFQEKFGRLEPSLPAKVLSDLPMASCNTKQILNKLNFDVKDACEFAALSQISTGPLTAWFALKLCDHLKKHEVMTIHLIGAEIEFEVDVLQKWELFFLHITPTVQELNVVFVGPELNPRNISFEQLKKTKPCRICRTNGRIVKYHFENVIYHDYCKTEAFLKPDLICFFNAGLYRSTGFNMEDTWPQTILAASALKCPVIVTSYTAHEAPLDMTQFILESNRRLNVVLPPTMNPFSSEKPERNFISDDEAPLMFKNYYCFVVE